MNPRIPIAIIGAACSAAASAQLVFGSSYYSSSAVGVSGAFHLDVETGIARQIWIGAGNNKVTALAADDNGQTIWFADNARFRNWAWGTEGTVPADLGGFYRLGSNGTTYATFVGSLAFARGRLYAYTNYNAGGSAAFVEDGIYAVDPTRPRPTANMDLVWSHPDLGYNFEGFDYSPETGKFYLTNNVTDPLRAGERGIYEFDLFGGGAPVKIADYSDFLTSPDGLAAGGGKLWLTEKATDWTSLRIEAFDLATRQFGNRHELPGFTTTSRFTGATWFVPPAKTTVSGRLTFGDWVGPRPFPAARFDLVPIEGGAVRTVSDVPVAADGSFTFEAGVVRAHRILVSAPGFLRTTLTPSVDLSGAPVAGLAADLVNGDVDGDDAVTVFDYDVLSAAFDTSAGGSGWDERADLDGDGAVTVFDYDILSRNFDRAGDSI